MTSVQTLVEKVIIRQLIRLYKKAKDGLLFVLI